MDSCRKRLGFIQCCGILFTNSKVLFKSVNLHFIPYNFIYHHWISCRFSIKICSKSLVGEKEIEKRAYLRPWAHFIHYWSGFISENGGNFAKTLNNLPLVFNNQFQALKFWSSFCFISFHINNGLNLTLRSDITLT